MLTTLFWPIVSAIWWIASTLLAAFLLIYLATIIYRVLVIHGYGISRGGLRPIEPHQAVLITGATSGIGLAVAKYLLSRGYSVLASYYDSSETGFQELKMLARDSNNNRRNATTPNKSSSSSSARAGGPQLHLIELNVRKEESISRAYEQVDQLLDSNGLHLYALINNAGLGSLQPFAWMQRKSISDLIETNLLGNLRATREFLPLIVKSKGRLIFVSSGLGFVAGATYATYGVTKQAQIYLSQCLNMELKKQFGVQSVAVIPHNFIKNTNISANVLRDNESAWQELRPTEREMYAKGFDEHIQLCKGLKGAIHERKQATINESQQDNQGQQLENQVMRTTTTTKSQNRQHQKREQTTISGNSLMELPMYVVKSAIKLIGDARASFEGKNTALNIEESGVLECFEKALRLEDPPEQIFAGDFIYQFVIGPLLLSLPLSCIGFLSSTVRPNLYK